MPTVFKNAQLFDGTGRNMIKDAVVIVGNDGRIEKVGKKDGIKLPLNNDVKVYDINNKYIFPGFIDSHIHIGSHGMVNTYEENLVDERLRAIRAVKEMEETLKSGFTTVRNCGSVNQMDFYVKKAVEKGYINGPRILACGQILSVTCSGTEYFKGLYRVADGYDEFKKAAREQLKMGADILKVMATGAIMNPGGFPGAEQPDVKEIEAVVEEGHKLGKRVAAHAHGAKGIKNAIKAGAATIEHASLADEEALEMISNNNIYIITTLLAGHLMINYGTQSGVPDFMIEKSKQVRALRIETLRKAIKVGVKIAMGSDAGVSPYNYHGRNADELIIYVKEGLMTPKEAVISATRNAAEACGMISEIGTIEEGKAADIIVFKENPLDNIEILSKKDNIRMVLKEGKVCKELDERA